MHCEDHLLLCCNLDLLDVYYPYWEHVSRNGGASGVTRNDLIVGTSVCSEVRMEMETRNMPAVGVSLNLSVRTSLMLLTIESCRPDTLAMFISI